MAQRAGLRFDGYLDPTRPAKLDGEHCVRINYEAFLFASVQNRDRFLADPIFYCGLLTDPVSKRRFRPGLNAPRTEHDGVLYFFEDPGNLERFARRPDDYRLPGWTMMGPRDPAWARHLEELEARETDRS